MKLTDIKPGRWYETKAGIGTCVKTGGTFPPSVMMRIVYPFPRGDVLMPPRDVLHEVPEPEEKP